MPNIKDRRGYEPDPFSLRLKELEREIEKVKRQNEEYSAELGRQRDIKGQYEEGKIASEEDFKRLTGRDLKDVAKEYMDTVDEAKSRKDLGMNALEFAPIAEGMKARRSALSSALSSSGISQGGLAAKLRLQNDRAYQIAKAQMDVAAKERGREDYEKRLSNVLKYGLTTSESRGSLFANISANLQSAKIQADANAKAQASVNSGGKVICTELHRQGYFSDEIIKLDNDFGKFLIKNYPIIYLGYYAWAKHVVSMMKNSSMITKIVSFFAIPWAYYIAHLMDNDIEYSYFGKLVFYVFIPFCFIVGITLKLYNKIGDLYVRFTRSFKEKIA